MVSLALTNAQTGAKIVLVIDYAQIFQVDSGFHAKFDTMDECDAGSANCDLNATLTLMASAIVFVTLVALEMKRHVVMQAPVAETVIVTSMPVARGPMVLSYAHVNHYQ